MKRKLRRSDFASSANATVQPHYLGGVTGNAAALKNTQVYPMQFCEDMYAWMQTADRDELLLSVPDDRDYVPQTEDLWIGDADAIPICQFLKLPCNRLAVG